MKKLIFLLLIIVHCALNISFGQYRQDRSIIRGNNTAITIKYPANITADSLIFQVRSNSSYTSTKHIEKKNSVAGGSILQMITSYTYPYTTITVNFSSANTSGLTIANYYFDLRKSVSPDSAVLVYGTFTIQSYSGEVVNIVPDFTGGNISDKMNAAAFQDSLANYDILYGNDTLSLSNRIDDLDLIATDSTDVKGLISDTSNVLRAESDLKYVDKTSTETITGRKRFIADTTKFGLNSTVRISDANITIDGDTSGDKPFFHATGRTGYGDWWGWYSNFSNPSGNPRKTQSMRFPSYNTSRGGGIINNKDGGIELLLETGYDFNNDITIPVLEAHLTMTDSTGIQYRAWSFAKKLRENWMGGYIQSDQFGLMKSNGNYYWLVIPDGFGSGTMDIYNNFRFRFDFNNAHFMSQTSAINGAQLQLPYFDASDRYYLANATTFYPPNGILSIYNAHTRLQNQKFYQLYNANGDVVNALGYSDDKLQIKADTTEDAYIYSRKLFHTDWNGNTTNLVNPTYPKDTTGLSIGKLYVDPITGNIKQMLGTNLVVNGDFSNWSSGYQPDSWTCTLPDTVNFYYENDGDKLHFVSNNYLLGQQVYQGSATNGVTYGYSFTVSQILDTFRLYISNTPIYITNTGVYTGEVLSTSSGGLIAIVPLAGSCEITIDNIDIWDLDGVKQTIVDGADWSVFYTNGNGKKIDLGIGANGTVLKSTGTTSAPSWQSDLTGVGGSAYADSVTINGRRVPGDSIMTIDATAAVVLTYVDSNYVLTSETTGWDKVSSNDLTTSTNFSGDITGNYNSLVVADNSHDHTNMFDTLAISWGILDTTYAGSLSGWKVPNDITITEISAYTDANTCTFNLEERGETTPNTAGTDVMSSDLVADNNQQETSTFSNANIAKNTWLVPTISATGDVSIFSITVRYIKQ